MHENPKFNQNFNVVHRKHVVKANICIGRRYISVCFSHICLFVSVKYPIGREIHGKSMEKIDIYRL